MEGKGKLKGQRGRCQGASGAGVGFSKFSGNSGESLPLNSDARIGLNKSWEQKTGGKGASNWKEGVWVVQRGSKAHSRLERIPPKSPEKTR